MRYTKVMKKSFRTPSEFAADEKEKTTPVSSRIRESSLEVLRRCAEKEGKSVAWLIGRVLEEYVAWLREKK